MKHNALLQGIAALSFIGVIDAAYLSYARFTHSELMCNIFEGCQVVAASPYSVLFGVPLAYAGLLFYVAIFACSFILLLRDSRLFQRLLVAGTAAGCLSSVYFVYVQAVLIKAFCIYCLISAGIATLLFVFSVFILNLKEDNSNETEHE